MPTIELDQAGDWLVRVEEGAQKAAVRGLHSAALRGLQDIVTRIIPSRSPQPVDRGIYRAGWRVALHPDGADIENTEPHAVFIEEGVRAEKVKLSGAMLRALAEWVVRKRIASPKQAEQVAWAIAQALQKKGIFGQRGMGVLRELVESGRLKTYVEEEVARELEGVG